ncbi:hypothetical protein [Clostridium celatum]|uniref:hypothetical protein n=1 Tax=Clostridium celatum TaxID=36834 RepID=UPI00319D882B
MNFKIDLSKDIYMDYLDGYYCVMYKNIGLMYSDYQYTKDDYTCGIINEAEEDEEDRYTIVVCLQSMILSTYGDWCTLEEAKEWLNNPVYLY